jgi:hypothetical protein
MGIYYAVPLLGPSLGPLVGGILANVSKTDRHAATVHSSSSSVLVLFLAINLLLYRGLCRIDFRLLHLLPRLMATGALAAVSGCGEASYQAGTGATAAGGEEATTKTAQGID